MNKILGPDPAVMDATGRGNKVVFFDIEMGEAGKGTPLGRIKLELFVKEVSNDKCSDPYGTHPAMIQI
jgi:hypothetical protein